jgi:hypothetical protein
MAETTPVPIADGQTLVFGQETFTFGKDVVELADSSGLARAEDFDGLRAKIAEEGYLFLRGFHPREVADAARWFVLETIRDQGGLDPSTDWREGIANERNTNYAFFRETAVAHAPPILDAVNGPHTISFYTQLLGGPVDTFDKRWLRAMAYGGNNSFHYDSAYVGRGTLHRYTMWSAFSDIGLDNGPLVVCLGSQKDERLIQTYGQIDMDQDLIDPVFSGDPREMVEKFGYTLATAHFQPGDVILFGMHMLHGSVPNQSHKYRISIDTRYQLASDPRDERFYGENGTWLGNYYNQGAEYTPMLEMRKMWGLE